MNIFYLWVHFLRNYFIVWIAIVFIISFILSIFGRGYLIAIFIACAYAFFLSMFHREQTYSNLGLNTEYILPKHKIFLMGITSLTGYFTGRVLLEDKGIIWHEKDLDIIPKQK